MFEIRRENGCPWDEKTCRFAASSGHLECLKYAHEKDVLGMKILVPMLPYVVISVSQAAKAGVLGAGKRRVGLLPVAVTSSV